MTYNTCPQTARTTYSQLGEQVYQTSPNTPNGNARLNAMADVLGQIGAAGAPSLKTEIEFWVQGRAEADENPAIALSLYNRAWGESQARGHPNPARC